MKVLRLIGLAALALAKPATVRRVDSSSLNDVQARKASSEKAHFDVPAYTFDMPVDHFDSSSKATYSNRYFVNDTYYKQGGPVILYDNGEAGFGPGSVAQMLAEESGASLPMRLAAKLGALVIGWEHRYYGYSRPVAMNDKTGFPVHGIEGYKYLSVEQALEDVAFFANNFNQTKLNQNNIVQSTSHLDPYNTPWIFVGGSYPGARAAWIRLKHPEIIYASWSSSAPLQYQFDGSPYYNPAVRSMPQNCTNDIKAAIKFVDETFAAGSSEETLSLIRAGAYVVTSNDTSLSDLDTASNTTSFDVGSSLATGITINDGYQSYGPAHSTQIMCDHMESFDVNKYMKDITSAEDVKEKIKMLLQNDGGVTPSKGGISGSNGSDGGLYAFAALVYGMVKATEEYNAFLNTIPPFEGDSESTDQVDNMSWSWQTLSETGIFQGSNPSNITVVSKFYNATAVSEYQYKEGYFSTFEESSLPQTINNSGLLAMGGWDMTASNVMFANGEFDPWRSFSIASQENAAPKRNIVQNVPQCNQLPPKNDVFGLIYAGAVHAEDMAESPYSTAALVGGKSPLQQGLGLFLSAWDTWSPCFNQSRDSIRNGKGVDGNGHGAGGNATSGAGGGGSKSGDAGLLVAFGSLTLIAPLASIFVLLCI